MHSRRLKVAIIGTGMIAAVHRRSAAIAGAELVGVLGSSIERSRQTATEWHARRAFATLEELTLSDVEVVHVCTPNATHAQYVEALLEAGKHVICEKPLGVTVEESQRLVDLAEQAGTVATVPFVYRYHPVVREIRARAQAGEFGTLNLLHGHYLQDWLVQPGVSNWRVDPEIGGQSRAFADIGSHWCDLVEWVSGQRLESVVAHRSLAVAERAEARASSFAQAAEGTRVKVETEDIATVLLRTTEGVPGSVVVSQVAPGRKNRLWFELNGSRGSAAFDQERPETAWLGSEQDSRVFSRDPGSGAPDQRRLSFLPAGHPQGYGDCFAAFVTDTYAAVDGAKPEGLPTFADGLRASQIVAAVLRSADSGTWMKVAS